MKSLILAIQFMTRVPLPAVDADMRDMAGAMRWFPLTGVIVGLAVWGAVWAGGLVDPLVAGAAGLIVWRRSPARFTLMVWATWPTHREARTRTPAGSRRSLPIRISAVSEWSP